MNRTNRVGKKKKIVTLLSQALEIALFLDMLYISFLFILLAATSLAYRDLAFKTKRVASGEKKASNHPKMK